MAGIMPDSVEVVLVAHGTALVRKLSGYPSPSGWGWQAGIHPAEEYSFSERKYGGNGIVALKAGREPGFQHRVLHTKIPACQPQPEEVGYPLQFPDQEADQFSVPWAASTISTLSGMMAAMCNTWQQGSLQPPYAKLRRWGLNRGRRDVEGHGPRTP